MARAPASGGRHARPFRGRGLLAAVVAVQLVLALVLARGWATLHDSLERTGRWSATKTDVEMRLMGARAFFTSRRTLASERLNLARWHGFQEVLAREPLPLERLACKVSFGADAWVCLLVEEAGGTFAGLRLSAHPRYPSQWLRADAVGAFLEVEPLALPTLEPDRVRRVALRVAPGHLAAELDGRPLGTFAARPADPARYGFRGGARPLWIDDVEARARDGRVLREDFAAGRLFAAALVVALLGCLVVDLAAWRLLRAGPRAVRRAVGALAGLALLAAGVLVVDRVVLAKDYPEPDADAERAFVQQELEVVDAALRERFPGPRQPDGPRRVLVVGSSQTWGAGATRPAEAYVPRLERRLAERVPVGVEVLGAGVQAALAPRLARALRERWIGHAPDVVVVDLSANDARLGDVETYAAALRDMVATSRAAGARVLFALEPLSPEVHLEPLPTHAAMRSVAEELGVALVDLHAALCAEDQSGFLWWDFVHPTSFGHDRIAAALAPEVERLLADP